MLHLIVLICHGRSVVQPLKMLVKLRDYKYPFYLKDLAKQRLEDSEYLSPTARQKLSSVRSVCCLPVCWDQ